VQAENAHAAAVSSMRHKVSVLVEPIEFLVKRSRNERVCVIENRLPAEGNGEPMCLLFIGPALAASFDGFTKNKLVQPNETEESDLMMASPF
jgi:hypothetical protein